MSRVCLSPGPIFSHPGLNEFTLPVERDATVAEIKDKYAKSEFGEDKPWPPDSPMAGHYDVRNSSAKMILVNNRTSPKRNRLRGYARGEGRQSEPDSDRHLPGISPQKNNARHEPCHSDASPRFPSPGPGTRRRHQRPPWNDPSSSYSCTETQSSQSKVPRENGVDYGKVLNSPYYSPYYCPYQFVGQPNPRRSPSRSVPSPLRKAFPFMASKDLNSGDRRYLLSLASIYSVRQMKQLKQEQYKDLLCQQYERGFHTTEEYERYMSYIGGPRKQQYDRGEGSDGPRHRTTSGSLLNRRRDGRPDTARSENGRSRERKEQPAHTTREAWPKGSETDRSSRPKKTPREKQRETFQKDAQKKRRIWIQKSLNEKDDPKNRRSENKDDAKIKHRSHEDDGKETKREERNSKNDDPAEKKKNKPEKKDSEEQLKSKSIPPIVVISAEETSGTTDEKQDEHEEPEDSHADEASQNSTKEGADDQPREMEEDRVSVNSDEKKDEKTSEEQLSATNDKMSNDRITAGDDQQAESESTEEDKYENNSEAGTHDTKSNETEAEDDNPETVDKPTVEEAAKSESISEGSAQSSHPSDPPEDDPNHKQEQIKTDATSDGVSGKSDTTDEEGKDESSTSLQQSEGQDEAKEEDRADSKVIDDKEANSPDAEDKSINKSHDEEEVISDENQKQHMDKMVQKADEITSNSDRDADDKVETVSNDKTEGEQSVTASPDKEEEVRKSVALAEGTEEDNHSRKSVNDNTTEETVQTPEGEDRSNETDNVLHNGKQDKADAVEDGENKEIETNEVMSTALGDKVEGSNITEAVKVDKEEEEDKADRDNQQDTDIIVKADETTDKAEDEHKAGQDKNQDIRDNVEAGGIRDKKESEDQGVESTSGENVTEQHQDTAAVDSDVTGNVDQSKETSQDDTEEVTMHNKDQVTKKLTENDDMEETEAESPDESQLTEETGGAPESMDVIPKEDNKGASTDGDPKSAEDIKDVKPDQSQPSHKTPESGDSPDSGKAEFHPEGVVTAASQLVTLNNSESIAPDSLQNKQNNETADNTPTPIEISQEIKETVGNEEAASSTDQKSENKVTERENGEETSNIPATEVATTNARTDSERNELTEGRDPISRENETNNAVGDIPQSPSQKQETENEAEMNAKNDDTKAQENGDDASSEVAKDGPEGESVKGDPLSSTPDFKKGETVSHHSVETMSQSTPEQRVDEADLNGEDSELVKENTLTSSGETNESNPVISGDRGSPEELSKYAQENDSSEGSRKGSPITPEMEDDSKMGTASSADTTLKTRVSAESHEEKSGTADKIAEEKDMRFSNVSDDGKATGSDRDKELAEFSGETDTDFQQPKSVTEVKEQQENTNEDVELPLENRSEDSNKDPDGKDAEQPNDSKKNDDISDVSRTATPDGTKSNPASEKELDRVHEDGTAEAKEINKEKREEKHAPPDESDGNHGDTDIKTRVGTEEIRDAVDKELKDTNIEHSKYEDVEDERLAGDENTSEKAVIGSQNESAGIEEGSEVHLDDEGSKAEKATEPNEQEESNADSFATRASPEVEPTDEHNQEKKATSGTSADEGKSEQIHPETIEHREERTSEEITKDMDVNEVDTKEKISSSQSLENEQKAEENTTSKNEVGEIEIKDGNGSSASLTSTDSHSPKPPTSPREGSARPRSRLGRPASGPQSNEAESTDGSKDVVQ